MSQKPHLIGFVINPISGMGGTVGLKGTDGEHILHQARELGALPQVQPRASEFLNKLKSFNNDSVIIAAPGIMGEDACKSSNIQHEVIPLSVFPHKLILYQTSHEDTKKAVQYFQKKKVALIIFLGGDGTARDIYEAIGQSIPCLGIPAGVKIHSPVFSVNPSTGAELTVEFLNGTATLLKSEVVDINEEAFRENRIETKLYGYLLSPHLPLLVQGMKQATPLTDMEHDNQKAIAKSIIEQMNTETYYILGPGTTVQMIATILNLPKSLLGFDIIKNKKLVASDVNEAQILQIIDNDPTELILSPIGRQGFVFGRGNLQITSKVLNKIKKEQINILCSLSKLSSLPDGCIRTDIRDQEMDKKLRGFYRVLVDFNTYRMIKMV